MPDSIRPSPRVFLVTGASRGIGRAVADRLEHDGAIVHRAARSLEPSGRAHRVDLLTEAGAAGLVEQVLRVDSRIDGVIHTPGDYAHGPLEGIRVDELERLFRSNVSTAMRVVEAARPAVRHARGSWILFGCAGLGGLRARRESAAYGAVKTALLVLARSMAVEEAPHGVRVNLVSPGLIPHEDAHPTTCEGNRLSRVPLGSAGALSSIGDAVAWLLSTQAAKVTGQDLEVAGGFAL